VELHCPVPECNVSYTLAYNSEEALRMVGAERNDDRMRRTALEEIEGSHPTHFTNTYMWKAVGNGPECRWMEADTMAARKAL
jgi:hypothetical protein